MNFKTCSLGFVAAGTALNPKGPLLPNTTESGNLRSPLNEGGISGQCDDGYFIVVKEKIAKYTRAHLICPRGYELADITDGIRFRRAVRTLFFCLGPLSEAWVGKAKVDGQIVPYENAVLAAPNVLEKNISDAIIQPRVVPGRKLQVELPAICQPAALLDV